MGKSTLYDEDKVIRFIINKYYSRSIIGKKELFQIGYIGYLTAVKRYDPKFGNMSLKYASFFIRKEISKELKRQYRESNHYEYDERAHGSSEDGSLMENRIDLKVAMEDVSEAMKVLSETERQVVERYYLSPRHTTLQAIADERGVSKPTIKETIDRAIEKLQGEMK